MLIHKESNLQLCTDSVSTADKHGTCYSLKVELKKTAEAAYVRADTRCHGACDMLLHKFNRAVTCGYIDSRLCVCL